MQEEKVVASSPRSVSDMCLREDIICSKAAKRVSSKLFQRVHENKVVRMSHLLLGGGLAARPAALITASDNNGTMRPITI